MLRSTLLAAVLTFGGFASGLTAQEQASPPARAEPGVGRPRADVDQFGLGVGVDLTRSTKRDLLAIPGILEELKVTDEQKGKLKDAEVQVRLAAAGLYKKIQDERNKLQQQGDGAAEAEFRAQTLAYAGQLTRDFERPLLKVLDRDQVKRLEQIQIRAMGPVAFGVAEVTDRLGLTPDQATAIAACVATGRTNIRTAAWPYRQASRELDQLPEDRRQARTDSEEFRASAAKARSAVLDARSATLRAIRKVLTIAQQATFRKMVGPPFDFGKLSPIPVDRKSAPPRDEAN